MEGDGHQIIIVGDGGLKIQTHTPLDLMLKFDSYF